MALWKRTNSKFKARPNIMDLPTTLGKPLRAAVGPTHKGIENLRNVGSPELRRVVGWQKQYDAFFASTATNALKKYEDMIAFIISHVEKNTNSIVLEALRPTFEKSKVYCPKDTGTGNPRSLINSARLEERTTGTGDNRSAQARITYGGSGVPYYALYVHEIPTYKHAPPTRSKFLQKAIIEDEYEIRVRIAKLAKIAILPYGRTAPEEY